MPNSSAGRSLWPVVAALGITQIIGYGTLYYAFASVAPFVAAEWDVPQEELFAYLSIGFLAGGFGAPVLGRLMDRVGAARVMTFGSIGNAIVFIAAAMSQSALMFAVATIVAQIIVVATAYDAAFATINQAAGARAQRTITHLTLIAGFSSTVFWPLTNWLVSAGNWRTAYLVFAGLHALLCAPLHAWLWQRASLLPHSARTTAASQQTGEPLPTHGARSFWMIAISFALSTALITALGTHLMGLLLARQLGPWATTIAMCVGPAQVGIRIANATLMKHLDPIHAALVSALALPVAAACLLAANGAWQPALAFALIFGVGQGLFSITRGTVPLALFGPQGYGKRLGQLAAVRTLLSAGAPFAFALVWHRTSLNLALGLCIVIGVAAAMPLLMVRSADRAGG